MIVASSFPLSSTSNPDVELFPEVPRVFYEAAPLIEVICQLRFPSVLRIERTPDDFQEQVRNEFPFFERAAAPKLTQLPPEIIEALGAQIAPINYRFRTEDGLTTLSLTPDALALSTTGYILWEEFWRQLRIGLDALVRVYRPSFYTRIGLRYRNSIDRQKLGLDDRPWADLLAPWIIGELTLPLFEGQVAEAARQLRVRLPDSKGAVFLQHSLAPSPAGSRVYVIDLDFYTDQKTEVEHAEPILDHFRKRAGWGFRWCITDTLHEALRPQPLADA